MSEAYDNAKEAFKELFDAGQINQRKITELESRNDDLENQNNQMKKGN